MTSSSSSSTNSCEGIEISAQDDRVYRSFVLENQLEVLLISHPDTDKASAAMDVHVGHLCDPENISGLAHFLEHMLFLGTEKYPDENSYSQFLSKHGGRSNAFTSMTDTNFYFDIAPDFFNEALDRFAQFFIAPLFTASATDREMQAVDSENAKNLQNDYWRFNQLYKHFAKEDHPFHKFGTGNLYTLDVLPKELGLDIREELLAFHQTYYSASIMKLVVYGPQDVDTLQTLVTNMFQAIPTTHRGIPIFEGGSPFDASQMQKRVDIAPVKDLSLIEIIWPIPSIRPYMRSKPSQYLSHVIGHEGKGSLLSNLKAKGWANELSAGVTKDEEDWALFSVTVEATQEGIVAVEAVVEMVYQYLAMLTAHGPQEWIYTEKRDIAEMSFRFKDKETPMSYTSALAGRMHQYATQDVISGPHLLHEFQPEVITALLQCLVPANMRLSVVSKAFQGKTESVEKWYQTPYSESSLSAEQLQRWSEALVDASALHLPSPNELISTDFALLRAGTASIPQLVLDNEQCRVWFKYDHVFEKPKLNVFLSLVTPMAYLSPQMAVLTDLYVECVQDCLTEYTYDAELAGMKYVLQHTMKGLEVYVSGYNHKLPLLVTQIIRAIRNLPALPADVFERIKDKTTRAYKNFSQEQPYQHAAYDSGYMLENARWHNRDKLAAIADLSMEMVLQHGDDALFAQVYVEALLHGNIHQEQACGIVTGVVSDLKANVLFSSQLPNLRIAQLDSKCAHVYQTAESNVDNNNSAIQMVFQLGPQSLRQSALLDVLAQMMQEPCFNQLRTIEQLGYIVFSGAFRSENIEHFRFVIQSDKMAPDALDSRIENFLTLFQLELNDMELEQVEKFKAAVKAKLLEKPKTPWEESMRHWRQITKNLYQFHSQQERAEVVETLTHASLVTFFNTFVAAGGAQRAKFSVQTFGNKHPVPTEEEVAVKEGTVYIQNMDAFKRAVPLYPAQGCPRSSTTGSRL